jgi:hypothetical protein
MSLILSGTDGLSDVDGSASTPAIRGTDTNTGIFFPAADTIAFAEGGSEVARFDSNGRLGINTTSPDALLTVNGVGAFGDGAASTPSISNTGDLNTGVWFPAADTIAFSTGGSERLRMDDNNRLLFGTTSAFYGSAGRAEFDINGSSEAILAFGTGGTAKGYLFHDGTTQFLYNVANGALTFGTNNAERMRIDSSGNVGIGATSLSYKLDIGTTSDASNYINIRTSTTGESGVFFSDTNSGQGGIRYSHTSDALRFFANDAEHMRITSSGRVGIGNSSPTDALTIGTNSAGGNIRINSSSAGGNGLLRFYDTANSEGMQINVDTSQLTFYGFGSRAMRFFTNETERARITSGGEFLIGITSGNLFEVYGSRGGQNLAAFTNTSSTGYGLTVAVSNNSSSTYRYFEGVESGTTQRIAIYTNGDVKNTNNSYGSLSDIKLKQDIVDAGSQWNDIKSLRIRKYRFKDNPDGSLQLGVIAQEIENVSPGLIENHPDEERVTRTREVEKTREVEVTPAVLDEEGNVVETAVMGTETYTDTEEYTECVATGTFTKSVKYSILYMKAVKALQEAMARIETLEAQNAAFEARLAALEAK